MTAILCGLAGIGAGGWALARGLGRGRRATSQSTDGLTGLHDRRRFDLDITRHAERDGEPVSVLMLDVDHLGSFNRSFGHPEGDSLLQTIGTVLTRQLRDPDVAYRYTGDRFAVLLPATEAAAAVIVAERIRRATETAALPVDGQVTTSVGVASGRAADIAVVVAEADAALASAKRSGRNRISIA